MAQAQRAEAMNASALPVFDSENVEPSWRTTIYDFTETIDSVYPDGSASVSATLDSFSTRIMGMNMVLKPMVSVWLAIDLTQS